MVTLFNSLYPRDSAGPPITGGHEPELPRGKFKNIDRQFVRLERIVGDLLDASQARVARFRLAIASDIAEARLGTVGMEDVEGSGACFVVKLPHRARVVA